MIAILPKKRYSAMLCTQQRKSDVAPAPVKQGIRSNQSRIRRTFFRVRVFIYNS